MVITVEEMDANVDFYLGHVKETGESIIITKDGEPYVQMTPPTQRD